MNDIDDIDLNARQQNDAALAALSELLGVDATKIMKITLEPLEHNDRSHRLLLTATMYATTIVDLNDLVRVLRQWYGTPLTAENVKQ